MPSGDAANIDVPDIRRACVNLAFISWAAVFSKAGRSLYYYRRDSSLGIDFIIRYLGEPALVEVKAKDSRAKAAMTILDNPGKCGIKHCIKMTESSLEMPEECLLYRNIWHSF